MTIDSQIISYIHQLAKQCQTSLQRKMVVLSGSEEWCFAIAQAVSNQSFLAISDQETLAAMDLFVPEKLHLALGKEFENILWDGFSGLSPSGLGIASGLLKAGGLFILLLPPLKVLRSEPDKDYIRMCSETFNVSDCHTFFLQRLIDHLQHEDIFLCEEGESELPSLSSSQQELAPAKSSLVISLPTSDQLSAIAAIKKVAFGHRNRPLVIQANRGRGKSSALGLAAAEIFLEKRFKTVITAPSKKTCEAAFYHYQQRIELALASSTEANAALHEFEFLPIDYILANNIDCHLLFIDEAAAIPTSILNKLLGRFSRVVYSTTIHGYEGNGQGFAIRFKHTLDQHYANWHSITLKQPIRWLEEDRLEPWFFRFLLLDTKLTKQGTELKQLSTALEKDSENQVPSLDIKPVTQQTLYEDEALFEQIISLLVIAHYQTSPSDIRLILDHPKINILIACTNQAPAYQTKEVYGVCLSIEEGGISSDELAQDILEGKRRPRGHLFPQALCASSARTEFVIQRSYRVMRIAVHPEMQHKGIGSNLLSVLKVHAQENHIDSLSSSYGLSPELLTFWQKNRFQMVKLGAKIDGASGLRSAMMMQAISAPAKQLLARSSEEFLRAFVFNLNRQHRALPTPLVAMIIQSSASSTSMTAACTKQSPLAAKKISAFAHAARALEETHLELFEWLLEQISSAKWTALSKDKKELLISQILQNRDYRVALEHSTLAGKKQLLTALRQAVRALLTGND